jgi:BirA family biotin operon repressor/biotin-[acetyl-CoA-carboxylase] ligase
MKINILFYDSVSSTNTEALNQAKLGADEGLCIVAHHQTAGRGRRGRTWVSDKDAGLYFSIVLKPQLAMHDLPLITLMAGVVVADTLREFGVEPDIKWVNDILASERKIAGILAETTETPTGIAVIVGIGVNIRSSNLPPEIAAIATSIEAENPSGSIPGVNELAIHLTKYLSRHYQTLSSPNGPAAVVGEWQQRSTYFSGKPVRVVTESGTITGVTDGLEPNGALRVTTDDGRTEIVQAGDVQNLRANAV